MRWLVLMILMPLVSACESARPSDSAICDGLERPAYELGDALLEDGGPRSVVAGERFLAGFDAACR